MALMIRRDRPSFPQETIDLILDEACDDKPTLMACSLVSSAFLPSSQRRLYMTIAFKCDEAYRYEKFLALMEANPALPTYVRALHINHIFLDFGIMDWDDDAEYTDPARVPFPSVLPGILKSLRSLRSLSLTTTEGMRWDMLDVRQQKMFLELIAAAPLRSITIRNISWPHSSFAQCMSLRELAITHPENDCDLQQKSDLASHGVLLRVIDLGCDIDVLPATFGMSYPFLQNFTATCASPSNISVCRDILRSATDTLGTLRLSIGAAAVLEPLQMRLPALRHLSVDFAEDNGRETLRWLLLFLDSLAAHLLEDIFLSLCGEVQTYDDALWDQFHGLLTHSPHFPRLHHVKIYVTICVEGGIDVSREDEAEAVSLLEQHLVSNSRVEFYLTSPYIEDELMIFSEMLSGDYFPQIQLSAPTTPE